MTVLPPTVLHSTTNYLSNYNTYIDNYHLPWYYSSVLSILCSIITVCDLLCTTCKDYRICLHARSGPSAHFGLFFDFFFKITFGVSVTICMKLVFYSGLSNEYTFIKQNFNNFKMIVQLLKYKIANISIIMLLFFLSIFGLCCD